MQVSQSREIVGRRIVTLIGRIEAASAWHAPEVGSVDWKARALEKLVRAAEDVEADAIVEVDFAVDGLRADHLADRLERISAKGVAVRLAKS